ncbi:MAG: CDP-alcohol phosphatidyltransferase family protein [Methylococcaceae bacterium]|nr:CDP-alcohol phosphatidyltransferase family protein [Methylococcaceae bacterium]
MSPRHIPNLITLLRILLVIPVVRLMLHGEYHWALALFAVAGISDGVDGFLAKRYGWQSRLGSYLDPLADKLLLISCFLATAYLGLLPVWLAAVVLLRDVVIVLGAVAYYILSQPFEGDPHWTSKVNTFTQLVLILAALLRQTVLEIPDALLDGLIGAVLLTTTGSGLLYVWSWSLRYLRDRAQ